MTTPKVSPQTDRILSQRSLYYLCKEVLGYKDMVPHVHGPMCDFFMSDRSRFKQATVPRSWFKTWVMTIGGAIWLTLPDEEGLFKSIFPFKGPNVRILLASNVIDNAARMINTIKRHWESNDRLKAAFPELIPDFNKTRWSDHCAEIKRSIKATEGTYTAVGVGGSVISQHFDWIHEDDLIYAKKDDFTGQELMPSQEDIDNAIGWHKLTFSLLVDPKRSCMFNVGTRWAPHDLIDYIQSNEEHYNCLELTCTKGGLWPVSSDKECLWPERYDRKTLEHIRSSQGPKIFECFPQEAPILMSDWTVKPISEVKLGDEVVGFTKGFNKFKSSLSKATVNLVEKMEKEVVKITLASGKVIRCTADHPWYTAKWDKTHKPYLPARVGGQLLMVYDMKEPSLAEMLDYRYLAGLIDGEGACSHGSIAIGQSKWANPDVYAGIESVLARLSLSYKISTVNPYDSHTLRNKTIVRGLGQSFVLHGGRQVKADIIRFGKPAKANRILKTIWGNPYHPIKGRDKVISIEPDGVETVYAIGTTTENYVAYGFATKNTQYLNRPRAGEDVTFDCSMLNKYDSIREYPTENVEWYTFVDLAGWNDNKRLARNCVLTGFKARNNHLYVGRVDVGRWNPSEVISKFKEHQKQFNSRVYIEEVQYQRAIRHFAKLDMENKGDFYHIEPIPYDGRKNAKDLRIQGLEPLVKNGAMHVLYSHKDLIQEMEDYPYGTTKDILDCATFLHRHASESGTMFSQGADFVDPFSREGLEEEFYRRGSTGFPYPFELQLGKPEGVRV
jgi:hypothetical protein